MKLYDDTIIEEKINDDSENNDRNQNENEFENQNINDNNISDNNNNNNNNTIDITIDNVIQNNQKNDNNSNNDSNLVLHSGGGGGGGGGGDKTITFDSASLFENSQSNIINPPQQIYNQKTEDTVAEERDDSVHLWQFYIKKNMEKKSMKKKN